MNNYTRILLFIAILAFIIPLACDETNVLDVPHAFYDTAEVTDMTEEAWEKLKFLREWGAFGDRTEEIQKRQIAFYNRHIDADRVSIIGNSATQDFHFENARIAFLLMTEKHPEMLRNPLRDYYYITISGGTGEIRSIGGQYYEYSILNHVPRDDVVHINNVPEYYSGENEDGTDRYTVCCGVTGTISMFTVVSNPRIVAGNIQANQRGTWGMATLVHELTHGIQILMSRDTNLTDMLEKAYSNAREKELWGWRTTSKDDIFHFFTTVTQAWFYSIGNRTYGNDFGPNRTTLRFHTPEDFIAYDPVMGKLITELFNYYPFQDILSADAVVERESQ